jgi:type III pantothenate kinase
MQGLVTIDFGNTNPHAGLFQKHQGEWNLVKVCPFSELSLYLSQLQLSPRNSQLVLSEVKAREEELNPLLEQGFLLTRVKDYWRGNKFAGMPVNYAQTLGEDRLIQAYYVFKKLKTDVLLIDAGTFVTMDLITNSGFQGGYIFPGLATYQASFQNGELLKSVKLSDSLSPELPKTTAEAMRDSYLAFAALAQKLILEHQIEKIVLTGGQSSLWKQIFDHLKVSVIVEVEPTLIHWALQYWMTTQIEPL